MNFLQWQQWLAASCRKNTTLALNSLFKQDTMVWNSHHRNIVKYVTFSSSNYVSSLWNITEKWWRKWFVAICSHFLDVCEIQSSIKLFHLILVLYWSSVIFGWCRVIFKLPFWEKSVYFRLNWNCMRTYIVWTSTRNSTVSISGK